MTTDFTGLIPELPHLLEERLAKQQALPVCAGREVAEKLHDEPPPWCRIESQARTNMCAVHGGTTVGEVCLYQKTGKLTQLSRNWLYRRAAEYCGIYSDSGRTLGSVIKAMSVDGCCPEDLWPFKGYADSNVPGGCADAAEQYKIATTIDVRTGGYDAVRTLIGQNMGAVLMATHWPIRYVDGYVAERYQATGSGGHARAWVFLSSRKDDLGRPYVWCANSHSEMAQHHGYELWAPAAVDEVLFKDPWGITGISDMTSPMPREVDWTGAANPFAK